MKNQQRDKTNVRYFTEMDGGWKMSVRVEAGNINTNCTDEGIPVIA